MRFRNLEKITAACRIAPLWFVPGLCLTNPSRSTFQAARTYTEFTMLPQGKATRVGWLMHGPLPFMGKVMHLFMNMDKMVGKDFESGLANLKRLTEK